MDRLEQRKSNIVVSAFLNIIRKACMIAFPLISYSYATRMLGTGGIGIYEFSQSIVNYFALIAALGIVNYAVRDGAALLSSHKINEGTSSAFTDFASEVFSINVVMTFISYILLTIVVNVASPLRGYRLTILLCSTSILFTTLAVDWVNSLFEDYLMLTIRYIVVQMIAIIALFIYVKTPADIYKYIVISILATVVNGVLNFVYVEKYVRIKFTFNLNLTKHALPIFILFCNNIASVIYLNSDVTMLGVMTDDRTVGLYGVATKIYIMIKELINAAIFVMIPRFSAYAKMSTDKVNEKYEAGLRNLLVPLFAVLVPACVGLFCLSGNVIGIIAGSDFAEAKVPLGILAVAMFFAVMACFLAFAIVMPYKLEKFFLVATSVAAIVNIILNIILIPIMGLNAAAITTLVAEILVFVILMKVSNKKVNVARLLSTRDYLCTIVGSLVIAIVCITVKGVVGSFVSGLGDAVANIVISLVCVAISLIVYIVILIIGKHSFVKLLVDNIANVKKGVFKK